MFNDIGALELVTLVVLAVLIFGPDKLPKVIQDVSRFIRKIREFSDSAKQDIRAELGPDFKDFEFEDLNPKTFLRKQLTENEDLAEIRSSLDLRKELNEVADTVKDGGPTAAADAGRSGTQQVAGPDLTKKPAVETARFDIDAT
ncbi:sec-independent translocase [Streptomyces sp. NRRL S-87]|uniref:sec-independent translocase n=1 Tax=Streptomyces sp. NRRL S-87 TaxID=1463920 RepID=UPI00056915EB|nr:sec-independent translocase [Streptomyces sp. NRRL S-87]